MLLIINTMEGAKNEIIKDLDKKEKEVEPVTNTASTEANQSSQKEEPSQ